MWGDAYSVPCLGMNMLLEIYPLQSTVLATYVAEQSVLYGTAQKQSAQIFFMHKTDLQPGPANFPNVMSSKYLICSCLSHKLKADAIYFKISYLYFAVLRFSDHKD